MLAPYVNQYNQILCMDKGDVFAMSFFFLKDLKLLLGLRISNI
jgi:hypothetical protein